MSSLDILYYSLAIGFLAISGLVTYLLYIVIQTVKSAQDVVKESKLVKNQAEVTGTGFLSGILAIIALVSNVLATKRR